MDANSSTYIYKIQYGWAMDLLTERTILLRPPNAIQLYKLVKQSKSLLSDKTLELLKSQSYKGEGKPKAY